MTLSFKVAVLQQKKSISNKNRIIWKMQTEKGTRNNKIIIDQLQFRLQTIDTRGTLKLEQVNPCTTANFKVKLSNHGTKTANVKS